MIYWIMIVAMIVIDQLVKYWAMTSLRPIGSIPLIQDVFHFTFAKKYRCSFQYFKRKASVPYHPDISCYSRPHVFNGKEY